MLDRDLLKRIYEKDRDNENLIFTHADKIWVIPKDALNAGMEMYQPTTRAGKCLKKSIIKKQKTPFFARRAKIKNEIIDLNKKFRKQLEELLGISKFYVAVYMGDTSTSQNDKAVLQIYNDNELLAYVKVTTNNENAKRFEKEAKSLQHLKELHIENVPNVIGIDLEAEIKAFAMSTEKPIGQKVDIVFNERILDCIKNISDKTKQTIDYKDSDFYKYVNYLKDNLDVLENEQQSIIKEAIERVEQSNIEEYSFYHGDFTPWNVYYNNNEIQLFDFEYCSDFMPLYMDTFHYLTQMSLLGIRNTAQCAMMQYEKYNDEISQYVEDSDFVYICYLLWVISFYLERSKDNVDRVQEMLDIRVEILEYLIRYRKDK